MDRSSHQSLRSERIAGSPYRRPAPKDAQSPSNTFSTVRNLFSSLFRSSSKDLVLPTTTSDLQVQVDQGSESGSEDNWSSAPPGMEGLNVYNLASSVNGGQATQSAGRTEVYGRGLPLPVTTPTASSSKQKRRLSPSISPPISRAPTRSFLPPAATALPQGQSASSAALAAFLEAKKGQQMTAEDLQVIDTLTRNLHSEIDSPNKAELRLGGWSAGQTPRTVKSNPAIREQVTPIRPNSTALTTPGSTFSVGAGGLFAASPKPSPYRVRYLGPGMSPRRILGKQTPSSGIKPLFQYSSPRATESVPKKQKTEQPADGQVTPSKSSALSSAVSLPNLSSFTDAPSTPAPVDKGKGRAEPSRPHPLSQSITTSPSAADPVAIGKKRAADIMKALIEEQTGPLDPPKENGTTPAPRVTSTSEQIIFNPYDRSSQSSVSSATSTPAEQRVFDSPRKSMLRASVKNTPKRGAAAKLDAKPSGRKLTALEKLSGVKPWEVNGDASTPQKTKSKALSTSIDVDEVDAVIAEAISTPSKPPAQPSVDPPVRAPKTIQEPAPFKPFDPPTLDSSAPPLPKFQSTSSPFNFESPSQTSALASSQRKEETPKLTFSVPSPASHVEEDEEAEELVLTVETKEKKKEETFDPNAIYLTAKEQALRVPKEALPFFTFVIKSKAKEDKYKAAKEEALKRPLPEFTFTLPEPSSKTAAPVAADVATDWTCDTCMLKNPASAKEKCTICEAPHPQATAAPKTAAPPVNEPFKWPSGSSAPAASADGQWTCDTCMLTNPASAKEKCTICEAPHPQATAAPKTAAPPVNEPFKWPSGSSAPAASADGQWTCDTCMLKNPASAKEKCTICEAPRP